MRNEHGDIIPPASFLPTAERFNLIGEIDRHMVEKGLRLAGEGRAVSINLSGGSIGDPEITGRVSAAISAGLDPRLVGFEYHRDQRGYEHGGLRGVRRPA